MNIKNFNSVQDIESSRKSINKIISYYAREPIHLKLLKNKRFSREQNSINRNNIELIIFETF